MFDEPPAIALKSPLAVLELPPLTVLSDPSARL